VRRVGAPALLAALLVGCGSLQPNDAGVSFLELHLPTCGGIEVGSTVTLAAKTLDQHGDSVSAPVWWRSPDTTIHVDSATGMVSGLTVSDTARVQALVGTKDPIISDLFPLVVTPFADTLAQTSAARVTVETNRTASEALIVTISHQTPPTRVKSFPLTYRVIEPVFASLDDRTVEFTGGKLTVTACSGPTGTPLVATVLNRRANKTQPDSAIVEVTAVHPDGSAVPGSGRRFTVLFKAPT